MNSYLRPWIIVMTSLVITLTPVSSLAAAAERSPTESEPSQLEALPEKYRTRLNERNTQLREGAASSRRLHPLYIIQLVKRWPPGKMLRVAFLGGTTELHQKIADAAKTWTQFGNLTLDFNEPGTSQFRTWTPADPTYRADIRISFDRGGYYSLVGTDAIDPALSRPGEESMNLARFDQVLPSNWRTVVLHEFGHALGFEHEHQHPVTPCDFRWDNDPGYVATKNVYGEFIPDPQGRRPGVYTVLGGPPNRWPKEQIDFNLRALPVSSAYDVSAFDGNSIMKYPFEAWMFVLGTRSECYSSRDNAELSAGDKAGIARAYPHAPAEQEQITRERESAIAELQRSAAVQLSARQQLDRIRTMK